MGIEPADERLPAGKAARAQFISMPITRALRFVIEVRDDCRGMDPVDLRARALRRAF